MVDEPTALQSNPDTGESKEETSETRDPRLCSFKRDDETLCGSYRVKGERLCAGHLGLGVAAGGDIARAHGAAGNAKRREVGEESRKTLKQRLAEGLEREAEAIEARLADIIRNGTDADALRAMESWLSRVHGRPTEHVQVEVPEPKTLADIRALTPEQRRVLLARMDGRTLALAPPLPEGDNPAQVQA